MASIVDQLVENYSAEERQFVFPTSKADAFAALDDLKATILEMPEFERFPEGSTGVIILALIQQAARISPDVGDFGHLCQGVEKILAVSKRVVGDKTRWFP